MRYRKDDGAAPRFFFLAGRSGNGWFQRRQRRSRELEHCPSQCRNITADVADDTAARLINVRFGPLCGLKPNIFRGPRSAMNGPYALQQARRIGRLLNHLVGAGKQSTRHRETERSGSLEVDG